MGSAAAILQSFQTDEWNADLYGTLSAVSAIAASVRKKANVLRLAYLLHRVNRHLKGLFDMVHSAAEGNLIPDPKTDPITPERARELLGDIMRMYRSVSGLYEALLRAGLSNNSITANQLLKLKANGEELLDLVDWVETSFNSDEVNALFSRASRERERGELYDLEQVI